MQRSTLIAAGGVAAVAAGWFALSVHQAPHPTPAFSTVQDEHAAARTARSPAPAGVEVYVAGEVARPGVYHLAAGGRVVDALRAAGDAKSDADLVAVNLAEPLRDGEEVAVPERGAVTAVRRSSTSAPRARKRGSPARKRSPRTARAKSDTEPGAPLDLNSADAQALAALPGIGEGLAERIVAFREENGPFDSVDELADVAGITPRRLDELIPYLTVGAR